MALKGNTNTYTVTSRLPLLPPKNSQQAAHSVSLARNATEILSPLHSANIELLLKVRPTPCSTLRKLLYYYSHYSYPQ